MSMSWSNGGAPAKTENGPASVPLPKLPPRSRVPGKLDEAASAPRPTQVRSEPKPGGQFEQADACSSQSATHSERFPTMSLVAWLEMQPAFAPVLWTEPENTLQGAPSGVPATAICHSAFNGSRLPELASACWAWNQVTLARGATPATERA